MYQVHLTTELWLPMWVNFWLGRPILWSTGCCFVTEQCISFWYLMQKIGCTTANDTDTKNKIKRTITEWCKIWEKSGGNSALKREYFQNLWKAVWINQSCLCCFLVWSDTPLQVTLQKRNKRYESLQVATSTWVRHEPGRNASPQLAAGFVLLWALSNRCPSCEQQGKPQGCPPTSSAFSPDNQRQHSFLIRSYWKSRDSMLLHRWQCMLRFSVNSAVLDGLKMTV